MIQRTNLENLEAATAPGPKPQQRLALSGFDHAVTGQKLMYQASEIRAYMRLGADYMEELRPVGIRETQMAQRIIDLNWRLNRLAAIENNILTFNCLGKAVEQSTGDPNTEGMVAQAHVWQTDTAYARTFEAISRYESRLTRMLIQLTKEFERLQDRRLAKAADTFVLADCAAWRWYRGDLRPDSVPSTAPAQAAQTCAA